MAKCLGNRYCGCNRCNKRRRLAEAAYNNPDDRSAREALERANAQSGRARGTRDGDRWTDGAGTTHTVNSTLDPNVPGGHYHTQVDVEGNKATAVYDEDGSLADIKQNSVWR